MRLIRLYYQFEADNKNSYLLDLEGAKERLSVCRADLLDRDNLNGVFRGCNGVFHIASPMFNTDPVSSHNFLKLEDIRTRAAYTYELTL